MDWSGVTQLLQAALALLFVVQSNPALPIEQRKAALDFSYQAIETATDAVSKMARPPISESGNPIVPSPLGVVKAPPGMEYGPTGQLQPIAPSIPQTPALSPITPSPIVTAPVVATPSEPKKSNLIEVLLSSLVNKLEVRLVKKIAVWFDFAPISEPETKLFLSKDGVTPYKRVSWV